MKKEPTSDCRAGVHCGAEDRDKALFWCRATGMQTPNMPKWCRHFLPDADAEPMPDTGYKTEPRRKRKETKKRRR